MIIFFRFRGIFDDRFFAEWMRTLLHARERFEWCSDDGEIGE